jgi:SAM-dependent methyltransferase
MFRRLNMTRRIRQALRSQRTKCECPPLEWLGPSSWKDHLKYRASVAEEIRRRRAMERALVVSDVFTVPGHCWRCSRHVAFEVNHQYAFVVDGLPTPNWREQLRCPECGLYSRTRATLHYLETCVLKTGDESIYIAEENSALFRYVSTRYQNVTGSEYFGEGGVPGQRDSSGFRHETLTSLTFPPDAFDCVLTQDVLEHIPRFEVALHEIARVLRSGGSFLFTVPFRLDDQEHLVRAVINEAGRVRHLHEPEYHGDPRREDGCLAFYQFGWELLDDLRRIGFAEASAFPVWSSEFVYLGEYQYLFLARKAA